jgi:ABC-type spermidine/putrescine transport system permease subunit I
MEVIFIMTRLKKIYSVIGLAAIIYFLILFFLPLAKTLITSVLSENKLDFTSYSTIFTNNTYSKVLIRTLYISVITTVITMILGYFLAYFIFTREAEKQKSWLILIISPMFMGLTIRLFGWMIILSNEGPVSKLVKMFSQNSIQLHLLFSYSAVVIGMVHYSLPFVVLSVYSSLKKLKRPVIEASKMLGASDSMTFWKVIFPLSLPGVFSGCSITFALSASTFLVPLMLGGPKNIFLSNVAYNSIINVGNYRLGAALSLTLLFIVAVILIIISMLERRFRID